MRRKQDAARRALAAAASFARAFIAGGQLLSQAPMLRLGLLLLASPTFAQPSQLDPTVTQVAAGNAHTCVLTTGGGVKCWGWNGYGQVGDGSGVTQLTPANVTGMASGVTAIAAGDSHTCALTTGGSVKCWGSNGFGQLGDSSTVNRSTPVNVNGLTSGVAAIAAGDGHTCALMAAGDVKCWGHNNGGQLGDGSTTNRSIPVAVSGLTRGATALAAGYYHTCVVTTARGVKCWGYNNTGQIGDGTGIDRPTPVDVTGLVSGVSAIATGGAHTCALTSEGGVKCWGYNYSGQLGDDSNTGKSTPVNVLGLLSGAIAITAGTYHTCALTTENGAKCWGSNSSGQIGDNSNTSRSAPVDVTGLTRGVTAISAGSVHTCALTTGGGVECWGTNNYGTLGDGSTTDRSTPVDVSGLASGVTAIAAGYGHTCALTTAGGVKCWCWDRRHSLLRCHSQYQAAALPDPPKNW